MTSSRKIMLAAVVGATVGFANSATVAQPPSDYPGKPVRLVIGSGAGGAVTAIMRLVGSTLSESWGQQLVIDNRPGAGNTIGPMIAAKANPDGYTLLLCPISDAIAPSLYKHLPYNLLKDFTPVSLIGTTANVMVVPPSMPARSVQEFVAYAKANPGKVNYGSGGVGTTAHLSMEWLKTMSGIDIVHVPYKSGAAIDLMSGRIQVMNQNLPTMLPHVRAGKIRALGVTSPTRSRQLPEVPTIAESGVPGYELVVWYGVCAPAAVPRSIIAKINSDLVKALNTANLRGRMEQHDFEARSSTPEQFAAFIQAETGKWAKVIKDAGIPPQ